MYREKWSSEEMEGASCRRERRAGLLMDGAIWKQQQFWLTHFTHCHLPCLGKKTREIFWMFLYLKVKLVHKINTYIIQCQKLVIYRNHPGLFFSTKEKKTWFNNSAFGTLANTVCIVQNKCSWVWALQHILMAQEPSSTVLIKRRTHTWRLCESTKDALSQCA